MPLFGSSLGDLEALMRLYRPADASIEGTAPVEVAPVAEPVVPAPVEEQPQVAPVQGDPEVDRLIGNARTRDLIDSLTQNDVADSFAMGMAGVDPSSLRTPKQNNFAELDAYLNAKNADTARMAEQGRATRAEEERALRMNMQEKLLNEREAAQDKKLALEEKKLASLDADRERKAAQTDQRISIHDRLASVKEKAILKKLARNGVSSTTGYLTHELIDSIPNADTASKAVMHDLLAKKDYKSLATKISEFDKVEQSMSQPQREKLASIDSALEAIETLKGMPRDADGYIKGIGGSMTDRLGVSYTGVGAIDTITGNLANLASSDDEQAARSLFMGIIDDLRKEKFGAAFTAPEAARWAKLAGEAMTASPKIRQQFIERFEAALRKAQANLLSGKRVGTEGGSSAPTKSSGNVTVTNKRTQQSITIPAAQAEKYRARPDAYEVK